MNSDGKKEQYFISYIKDIAALSEKQRVYKFSGFLNEREQDLACQAVRALSDIEYVFFGGYDNSERKILKVSVQDLPYDEPYPIIALNITIKSGGLALDHRSILGSLMALGIKREMVGDILLLSDNEALIFVKDSIYDFIKTNLTKIGKNFCEIVEADINKINIPVKDTEKIVINIASERLDCFVGAVNHLSRGRSSDFICAGKVFVNQIPVLDSSYKIKSGDKISVRGSGKFILGDCLSTTKSGKLKYIVEKF